MHRGVEQNRRPIPSLIGSVISEPGADHKVLLRDVASVEGIRDNSLVGYGLVVGLKGTGDKQQTYFTIQTLASILQRMGVEIPPSVVQTTVQVKNVAAVFVTASLPPFSRPGMPLDVDRLLCWRCAQPRRRVAAADAAVCGGRPGLCGRTGAAGGGRLRGGIGGELQAGKSSYGGPDSEWGVWSSATARWI